MTTCLAALGLMFAGAPALAGAADRDAVLQVVRAVVIAENRKDRDLLNAVTWPEGNFSVTGAGETQAKATRHKWRELIFSGTGVTVRTKLATPSISIRGDRATAQVRERGLFLYDGEPSGSGFIAQDSVELEQRQGQWRVLNWLRRIENTGSDATWRRRNP